MDELDREEGQGIRYFGNYLVLLAGLSPPNHVRGARSWFRAGFLMVIRRNWYWVTAGHIIREVEDALSQKQIEERDFWLVDGFGDGAFSGHSIPFDYAGAYKYYRFEEQQGLDFGLVEITPYYRSLLKANGIRTVYKKDWKNQHRLQFDIHFMFGVPEDAIQNAICSRSNGYVVRGKPIPTAVYIEQVDKVKSEHLRAHPRFVGQIPKRHRASVKDLVGMSGGPIFGYTDEDPDRCYIVAVQSSWYPKQGVTFGCPVPVFAKLAEEQLKQDGR